MTKWKIIVLLLVVSIISAAAGLTIGFREGLKAGGISANLYEMVTSSEHMKAQFANADCEGLKNSLEDFLLMVERYRTVDNPLFTETTYYGDLMITHLRLSRIEKKLGNSNEAQSHMLKAQNACLKRGFKDCSETKLIDFSKRLEEKNPIACLADN